ncbi:MAG: hypothetical protein GYB65_06790 [Chloroflexi bacterium]|nr:hypothetical protein [Chloroflexota bacterium]
MNIQHYEAFTTALVQTLERDPRVLGLMAMGSMARQSHQPDEWSDHDFWVVVQPGAVAWFRTRRDWLPNDDRIVLHFIDTQHDGITAIYGSGHFVEFAVSDRGGLQHIKVNDYRLLIDRVGLAEDVAQLQHATSAEMDLLGQNEVCLVGRFLTALLIGIGRYRRGELLSARQLITVTAPQALLRLIARFLPPEQPAPLDNIDPLRRFEQAYPEIGGTINALLRLELDQAAVDLLDLGERLLRDRVPWYPVEAAAAVRRRLCAVSATPESYSR